MTQCVTVAPLKNIRGTYLVRTICCLFNMLISLRNIYSHQSWNQRTQFWSSYTQRALRWAAMSRKIEVGYYSFCVASIVMPQCHYYYAVNCILSQHLHHSSILSPTSTRYAITATPLEQVPSGSPRLSCQQQCHPHPRCTFPESHKN